MSVISCEKILSKKYVNNFCKFYKEIFNSPLYPKTLSQYGHFSGLGCDEVLLATGLETLLARLIVELLRLELSYAVLRCSYGITGCDLMLVSLALRCNYTKSNM